MLATGEKISFYIIHSSLGAGGMGEIYRARDTRLERDVAIKILPENLMSDESAIGRFKREAHAVSALNHPNILTIFDIGEHEKIHFIATELVEGKTLRQCLEHAPFNLTDILDVAVQAAHALAAAHDAKIVHRDIKPENIMIRADGYVKILDFGIAKPLGALNAERRTQNDENETLIQSSPDIPRSAFRIPHSTTPGTIIGTAVYMSPEQARGLELDHRSDIFSLGVVIYELISGRPPFSGATPSDVIAQILTSEPQPLGATANNIPKALETVVGKALKKKIEERYQTMKAFLHDLKRINLHLEFDNDLVNIGRVEIIGKAATKKDLAEQATQILPKTSSQKPRTKTRRQIDSLAVLPLVNDSKDANAEYLSDGITEWIINSLSKLPKLRVVPRSTVFRYKGKETDLQEVGHELGVRTVFAGRIVQIGGHLIVKAELVDIANEAQIWGEQYRRKTNDIFTLLEEIAADISEELRLKLSGKDKKQLAKRYTENTRAYQFYLKGRYFVTTKRTEEWIKRGIEYFKKAIDLDPNYALAYSGIAEAYGFLASSTGGWLPRKAYPKAEAAALKALEIDDALGEAHCSLGFSYLLYDWDFTRAEHEFKRAIELSPNYPNAHDGYGFFLKAVGRHREAIAKCKHAQQLDPLSPFAHVSLGYAYYFARDFKKAIQECKKALEIDRNSTFAYRNLGLAYLQQKKYTEAIEALSRAVEFSCGGLAFESYLGFAYAVSGNRADAEKVLASLKEIQKNCYVPAYNFAMIFAGLGEFDRAFEWLGKAFKERSGFLPFLKVEPVVDCLRGDARFDKLLRRIGLS